jgi:hypothetical protein
MRAFLQVLVLLASATQTPRSLEFSIAPLKGTYTSGEPMTLRCKFKNVTSSRQTVRRVPHDRSDAPSFIRARVWSERGALLTKNDITPDGWWTVRALDSMVYREGDLDRVTVEAGQELTFDVDLAVILRGCRSLEARPLRAGRYRVQLDSDFGPSNELPIELKSRSTPKVRPR